MPSILDRLFGRGKKEEEEEKAPERVSEEAARKRREELARKRRESAEARKRFEEREKGRLAAKAKAEEAARTYVVKSGDSLSKIAKELYGDAKRWPEIYEANKELIGDDPNLIHPGQELKIP